MTGQPLTTRIVAVRHGETAWNVETRIQGQLDVGLNAKGRWQAARVAEALAGEGIELIVSSDLARAHETAQAIGAATGLEVLSDAGLRERSFGSFEGRTWAEIEQWWPEQSARWRARDLDFAPDGGETLRAFYARIVGCAERLARQHAGRMLAFVAHGGVMDCLYRAAARTGLDAPRTWQLGNTAINRLLHTEQGFSLVGWSDTSHLDGLQHDEFSDGSVGDGLSAPGAVGRAAA